MNEPQIKEVYDPYNKNNKKRKEVALIAPTYDQYQITRKLIYLLKKQTLVPDIIVVDNNSSDETFKKLKDEFNDIILIKAKDNYGSSGGQYLGQRYAYEKGYEYIILNDNDAYPIDKDLIESLIKEKKEYPGAVSSSHYFSKLINQYVSVHAFHFLTTDKKIIESVGFVNWKYFLKIDDMDYTTRISRKFGPIKIINKNYFHPTKHIFNLFRYFDMRNGLYKDLTLNKNLKGVFYFLRRLVFLNIAHIFLTLAILKKRKIDFKFLHLLFYRTFVDGVIKKLDVNNKLIIKEIIKRSKYPKILELDTKQKYIIFTGLGSSNEPVKLLKKGYNLKDENIILFRYERKKWLKSITKLIGLISKHHNLIISSIAEELYPILILAKNIYFMDIIDNPKNVKELELKCVLY